MNHLIYTGIKGLIKSFFGQSEQVLDSKNRILAKYAYYDKEALAQLLVNQSNLTSEQINKINQKFLEIVHPFNDKPITTEDLKKHNIIFKNKCDTYDDCITRLEAIKQQTAPFTQLFYKEKLSELAPLLKAGDILVRKYHADNKNPICDLQKIFQKKTFREAYKCSHIAMYLGEKNGKQWVAEATLPQDNEPQVRRLQLDDARFDSKDKNQYIVIRNRDSDIAQEAANIAKKYTVKMPMETDGLDDKSKSIKYSHIEAVRSLWHSKDFAFFAKHRIFKYFSDDHNNVPFQYILKNRMLYCSEFVLLAEQLAEVKKSSEFHEIIAKNPPPISHEKNYTSFLGKLIAKISYVTRRAFWSRIMAAKYSESLDNIVKTKLDFLRSSPQDTINYLMKDHKNYEVIGFINKERLTMTS